MLMASKGHFLMQILQPMHRGLERCAILDLGPTSMQSFPSLTTGHDFLHSCLHFLGLHFSALTMAIRVRWSAGLSDFLMAFFLGGIL